ncbi:G patch domain-containing protein 8 [Quillaja saponaria]|uniref:G patch domain-containing protein 8 n=1 Tax=Quillaja saponaria TaxID=32244 RepID=A0AAD7KZB4_QUISA|nr:G patch domain-containing protein 8 [Quillaja saponaria]
MRKPSSFLKKNSSKSSSKARRRSESKSRSRTYKSKKIRRHIKSLSSSENDDSRSSVSLSSSHSEDNYRSRRARSCTRKDVNGSKKGAPRRSSSSENSEDSLHVRKRRRSKRKNDFEVRKKTYKKKKLSRESSVSSISSDDSEVERCRVRPAGRGKDKRNLKRVKGAKERSRYSSKSHSSRRHCSESCDHWNEEKHTSENTSRWLRSVITVARDIKEGEESDRNEIKEELIYDHDFPCKSNDSNDGGSKREVDDNSMIVTEENMEQDIDADFKFTTPKIKDCSNSGEGHSDRSNYKDDGVGTDERLQPVEEKTSETSSVVGSLNGDDLESILRQRALENLRKFQGGHQTYAKAYYDESKIGSDVKQLHVKVDKLVQNGASAEAKSTEETLIVKESNVPGVRGYPVSSSKNNERTLNENSKSESACGLEQVTNAGNFNETVKTALSYVNNNPNLTAPASIHQSSHSHPTLKRRPVPGPSQEKLVESAIDNASYINKSYSTTTKISSSLKPMLRRISSKKWQDEVKECPNFDSKQTLTSPEPHTKLLVTKGGMHNQAVHTAQTVTQNIDNNGIVPDNSCDSAAPLSSRNKSTSGENGSNKLLNEANQGSQFEQKTMNVMRGGEMVQVSYKVYIPKKAPALTRRQLKR